MNLNEHVYSAFVFPDRKHIFLIVMFFYLTLFNKLCMFILCFISMISGVLFCVGGRGASGDPYKTIECFHPMKDCWFQLPEMFVRRRHVGVCCLNGTINSSKYSTVYNMNNVCLFYQVLILKQNNNKLKPLFLANFLYGMQLKIFFSFILK